MFSKCKRRCWVPNCRNSKVKRVLETHTQLYKFPRNAKRCREWLRVIGDPDLAKCTWERLTTNRYVCRCHFLERHITASKRISVDGVPTIFDDLRTPLPEAELLFYDETVPVERSLHDFKNYEGLKSHVQELPIMADILVDAESIIKLEEIKEEPNDNTEESPWNLLDLGDSNSFNFSVKKEYNVKEDEVHPPLPLPEEEVAEIKQEKEEQLEPAAVVFIKSETYETYSVGEDKVQPLLPLLVPKEEVVEIKQEEEEQLEPPAAVFIKSETYENYAEGEDPVVSCSEDPFGDSLIQEASPFTPVGDVLQVVVGDPSSGKSSAKSGGSSSEDYENEGSAKPVELLPQRDARERIPAPHWDPSMKLRLVLLATSGECTVSEAGRRLGLPAATARRWMRLWRETGNLWRRGGTGRWRVSSAVEDDRLLAVARSNPFLSSSELKDALAFPGCPRTVRNRLRDAGVCPGWFPKILDAHRVDRLAFALDNAAREWGDVVFSSACVFSAAEDRPVRVFRPQVTQHNAGYVPEPQDCGRASVACWGWMSARGVGVVTRIEPAPLAAQYLHFLRNVMLPSVRVLYPEGSFYFQQDQLRVHKTDFVQEWLASQDEFEVVDWPPCSSDLNPMENVWEETKHVMAENWPRPHPKTCDALWELVSDAWDEVASSEDSVARFVSSMPRRLLEVIGREGSWVGV